MGLFSDTCDTPIDPATGRALTGEALQAALAEKKSPRCRASVKKKAKFCSKCGSPAPGGWIRCPNPKCGKWVGNESAFCPHCRQPLNPGDRLEVEGGRWVRPEGELARRFETMNLIHEMKTAGLVVEAGTRALLLDGGKVKDVLEAGTHTVESVGHKINHWGNPPPRTVVLVDATEHELEIVLSDLRDVQQQLVDLRIVLRWQVGRKERQMEQFFAQAMGGQTRISTTKMISFLEDELRSRLKVELRNLDAEAYLSDLEGREKLLNALGKGLGDSLGLYGLEITQVPVLDISCPEVEELLERSGSLLRQQRGWSLEQETMSLEKAMHAERTRHAFDTRDLTEATRHEQAMRDLARATEQEQAELRSREDLKRSQAERDLDVKNLVLDDQRSNKVKDELNVDEIDRLSHQRTLDKDMAEHDQSVRKTKDALELRKLKDGMKHEEGKLEIERLSMKAKVLQDLKPEVLLALEPDASVRKDLQSFFELRAKGEMSPEALLVLLAEKSPSAGQALFEKSGLERKNWERLIETERSDLREMLDRQERMFNRAQDTTSEAAKSRPGAKVNVRK